MSTGCFLVLEREVRKRSLSPTWILEKLSWGEDAGLLSGQLGDAKEQTGSLVRWTARAEVHTSFKVPCSPPAGQGVQMHGLPEVTTVS